MSGSNQLAQTVNTGGLALSCTVDLTGADGAVFVNRFNYRVRGTRHKSNGRPIIEWQADP